MPRNIYLKMKSLDEARRIVCDRLAPLRGDGGESLASSRHVKHYKRRKRWLS